ncbi:MAG TPA: 1-phosphofructokinase [Nitriliruptorales bacterium]|nr:1-phosphofructokinase [Nitriliruptorales bacterium]
MIVTVTPNPSLDRTLAIERLSRGQLLRASSVRVEPGGKGINVARALIANGEAAQAVVPLGGGDGEQLQSLLGELGLTVVAVPIAATVRTNVTLVEPDGTVTKINAPGPHLHDHEVEDLRKAAVAAIGDASWVAACGSLPPGADDGLYAELVGDVRRAGARVAVDTSGPPLRACVTAAPDLIKPNLQELQDLVGAELATFGAVVGAADGLRRQGVGAVVVSLGALGAVLIDHHGAVHADTPPVEPVSDVGAGDALLAGFLSAGGAGHQALRAAVAWGAAAVQLPGTAMPSPADLDTTAVRLRDVETDRPLTTEGAPA